ELLGERQVGLAIDVELADAVQVLDHRDARAFGDRLDQLLSTAGDDDVDELVLLEEYLHGGAVGAAHERDRLARNRRGGVAQDVGDEAIGAKRLAPAS